MNWFEGKKIVVPIDFGELSKEVVDTALEMVFRPADVRIVFVASDLAAMAPEVVWQDISENTRRANVQASFEETFADEKYQGLTCEVRFGDPAHEITEFAQEVGADLIVMPSHGRTGVHRFLMGSVAERVLRLARCPVLVLKR